jgi:multidrug efflux pump subunit AcrA (membrane-fusion protein)
VLVSITTATVKNVLVVPVDALIALSGGGYAVEVDSGGSRHLVPVTLGMFDDAEGLVQVSGSGLREGQRVVVPAS